MSEDMGIKKPQRAAKNTETAREARLKAALKANMARRKAQAKARSGQIDAANSPQDGPDKE